MLNKLFKLFTPETEISKDKEVDLHEENDFNEVCDDHFIIDEYQKPYKTLQNLKN